MEGIGINLGALLVHILNFFILFVVLYAWVYKPLIKMIDKRRADEARGIEDVAIAAEARISAEQEATTIVEDAKKKAGVMIREATERADIAADEMVVKAEKTIREERLNAMRDVEKERTRIFNEMRDQMIGLSIAGAEKILGEKIDLEKQHLLLDRFFINLKNSEFNFPADHSYKGEAVRITSAVTLSDNQKNALMELIYKKLNEKDLDFDFRVNPDILGGLVVRVGEVIVDDSVEGKLHHLRQSLT